MFCKLFVIAAVVLTLSAQAHAHAAIAPALAVTGTPKRADVQRPSTATPCGNTNIAANIDKSTPVIAAADGTFAVTVTNFNAGSDGSRQVTMTVDATGAGKNFAAGTVSKNGVLAPTSTGSDQVTASLPAGTTCTGGAAKNLCIASFKTAAGFGNCVVVQQGAAAGAATPAGGAVTPAGGAVTPAGGAAVPPANNGTPVPVANTGTGTGKGAKAKAAGPAATNNGIAAIPSTGATTGTGNGRKTNKVKAAAGTRAARARRAVLEAENDVEARNFDFEVVKRSVISWIWA